MMPRPDASTLTADVDVPDTCDAFEHDTTSGTTRRVNPAAPPREFRPFIDIGGIKVPMKER